MAVSGVASSRWQEETTRGVGFVKRAAAALPHSRTTVARISMPSAPAPVRVLFLAGMGRSGTTLFERVLSSVPGVVGVGELMHMWERGLQADELCGCGQPFSACSFWSTVGQVAFGGWDRVDVNHVLDLRGRVDRVRHVPSLLTQRFRRDTDPHVTSYAAYYAQVYRAVQHVTGAVLVVDSSKQASLPHVLAHDESIDLRVVHAVRDARAVCYAWTKRMRRPEVADTASFMPRYTPVTMARMWTSHNVAVEMMRTRAHIHRLRYEDFVEDPRASVIRVLDFVGVDPVEAIENGFLDHIHPDHVTLPMAHTVAGNPMRFRTGAISLLPDEAWRDAMPAEQRRLVTAMTAPLLMRYGYRLQVNGSS